MRKERNRGLQQSQWSKEPRWSRELRRSRQSAEPKRSRQSWKPGWSQQRAKAGPVEQEASAEPAEQEAMAELESSTAEQTGLKGLPTVELRTISVELMVQGTTNMDQAGLEQRTQRG